MDEGTVKVSYEKISICLSTSRGTDHVNNSYISFHSSRQLKQQSPNNRVMPDLSLADIITTVENLTLDKVNNFVQTTVLLEEDGQSAFKNNTGGVHSNVTIRVESEYIMTKTIIISYFSQL